MSVARRARLLLEGGLVAFPTETVYGLGGDATNERAVAAIFAAKGRPQFNPLISHVLDPARRKRLVRWNDTADKLAARFWPGPLTLVLPRAEGLADLRCWRRPASTRSRCARRRIPWRRR